jgi:hypothetical protein
MTSLFGLDASYSLHVVDAEISNLKGQKTLPNLSTRLYLSNY